MGRSCGGAALERTRKQAREGGREGALCVSREVDVFCVEKAK